MDSLARLASLPVYWGHGTQDDQVPVERARRDVARLRQAGVDVSYCEADVGHKLGADCLLGLASWLARGPGAPRPGRRNVISSASRAYPTTSSPVRDHGEGAILARRFPADVAASIHPPA